MGRPKKPSPYDALMIRQLQDGGLPLIDSASLIPIGGKKPGARLKSERPLLSSPWDTWNMRKERAAALRKRDRRFMIELHIAARLDEYAKVRGALFKVGAAGEYNRNDRLRRIRRDYKNHPLKPGLVTPFRPYFSDILDRIGLPEIKK